MAKLAFPGAFNQIYYFLAWLRVGCYNKAFAAFNEA
jgi:hypothetical protein